MLAALLAPAWVSLILSALAFVLGPAVLALAVLGATVIFVPGVLVIANHAAWHRLLRLVACLAYVVAAEATYVGVFAAAGKVLPAT